MRTLHGDSQLERVEYFLINYQQLFRICFVYFQLKTKAKKWFSSQGFNAKRTFLRLSCSFKSFMFSFAMIMKHQRRIVMIVIFKFIYGWCIYMYIVLTVLKYIFSTWSITYQPRTMYSFQVDNVFIKYTNSIQPSQLYVPATIGF